MIGEHIQSQREKTGHREKICVVLRRTKIPGQLRLLGTASFITSV